MNCAIYVRVSSEDQVRGTSLESQEAQCRQHAERNGWTVLRVYRDEGASAKTADRPQFQQMLRDLSRSGAGVERLVIWKLDRFARSMDDHVECRRRLAASGVYIASATEPLSKDPIMNLQTVHAMLRQKVYCGKIESALTNGLTINAQFQGLVDDDTWRTVQLVLDGRTTRRAPLRAANNDFPLAGICRCEHCLAPMRGYWAKGRSRRFAYYDCRSGCDGMRRTQPRLHDEFEDALNSITVAHAGHVRLSREVLVRRHAQLVEDAVRRLEETRRAIAAIESKSAKLLELLLDNTISRETYAARKAQLDMDLLALRHVAEVPQLTPERIQNVLDRACFMVQRLGAIWRLAGHTQRRRFEMAIFSHRLAYHRDNGFRTAITDNVFSGLRRTQFETSTMAPPTGCTSNHFKNLADALDLLADLTAA